MNPYAAVAAWVAACPKITLSDYVQACLGKHGIKLVAAPFAKNEEPISTKDLVSILCAIGLFEPRGATEPRACDIVSVYDQMVEVEPATLANDGSVIPAEKTLIKICAPQHRSLVVSNLRGLAANLTAAENGEVVSQSMKVNGFSEAFCPPGEPGKGNDRGVFSNAEHIILCPHSGFNLKGRNNDDTSPALFHVSAVVWGTC